MGGVTYNSRRGSIGLHCHLIHTTAYKCDLLHTYVERWQFHFTHTHTCSETCCNKATLRDSVTTLSFLLLRKASHSRKEKKQLNTMVTHTTVAE